MMNVTNFVKFEFQSLPENVAFARACVGAFAAQIECTLEDIEEIRLVVSEAVSNSIIHGYDNRPGEKVEIMVTIMNHDTLEIIIKDYGKGISNLEQALEPAYSSEPGRMGMGFTFMRSFMDEMEVLSQPGEGTSVRLRRSFRVHDDSVLA
ncbi:MAG: anti-sigma F factor [Syntrophomonadaceae bacterium]|jgi:stage II sporulation protein AB (anti-sigma F factor)